MGRTDGALKLLSDYLERNAQLYPDKEAVLYEDQRITWKEYNEKSKVLARYLLKIGVQRHDRISYLMNTCPEWLVLYMAASRVGAILVGCGTALMPPEIEYQVTNSESKYIFVTGGFDPSLPKKIAQIWPDCKTVKGVYQVEGDLIPGALNYYDIFKEDYMEYDDALKEREFQLDTWDGLLTVYTSGTTGKPKGALMSHRNIIISCLVESDEMDNKPDSVWMAQLPCNHVGEATELAITPMMTGAKVILLPKFSPHKTLELIEKERISILGQVPTMFAMLFNLPDYDKYDKSSIETVYISGSPAERKLLEKMFATLSTHVTNSLGMSETAGLTTYTPKWSDIETLIKSVGKVFPELELRLVDKDRKTVHRGEIGEIAYRGDTVIKGYLANEKATKEAIDENGWFYAGDMAMEDEDGLLIMMGRTKEMFICGGENVYPPEVEEAIRQYDKVEECAVVAVPDPILQEVGRAYIIPKEGCTINEEELKAYLKKNLAKYKIPHQFIFRKELPLTSIGKIEKKKLNQEVAQEYKHAS
ncbi:MAG TPA: class I adenylate-forming enzyme family protein [Syntrophomonadaceae bacterium]|nr:class I adenylate-forming enzyme family protein [Syntrophomonadaceae bacterium]